MAFRPVNYLAYKYCYWLTNLQYKVSTGLSISYFLDVCTPVNITNIRWLPGLYNISVNDKNICFRNENYNILLISKSICFYSNDFTACEFAITLSIMVLFNCNAPKLLKEHWQNINDIRIICYIMKLSSTGECILQRTQPNKNRKLLFLSEY